MLVGTSLHLWILFQEGFAGKDELGVEYALEAIGKSGNKKTSLTLDAFLRPEKVVKATLTSPMLTASVEGRITTTDTEKSILLRLVQDKDEYFGKVGVSIQGSPDRAIYKPIVEYKIPQGSGKFDLKIEGFFPKMSSRYSSALLQR
jgi:hypothetical protein